MKDFFAKNQLKLSLRFFAAFAFLFCSLIFSCDLSLGADLREELTDDITARYTFFEDATNPDATKISVDMKIGDRKDSETLFDGDVTSFERGKKGFKIVGWEYLKNPIDGSMAAPSNFSLDENNYISAVVVTPQPAWIVAKWEAPYTVRHLFQDLVSQEDGSYKFSEYEDEVLYGKVDALTQGAAKEKEGFTARPFRQVEISGNGDTVLEIYYERNKYTYTFDLSGGVSAQFAERNTLSGRYGEKLVVDTPEYSGYKFSNWQPPLPETFMPNYSGFVAKWWSGDSAYTVRYHLQHADDDGYEIEEETEYGATDSFTKVYAKTYEGFSMLPFEQKVILSGGETVVDVFYNRNTVVYTFSLTGGTTTTPFSTVTADGGTLSGRYETPFSIEAPTRLGFSFTGWQPELPDKFGSANATFAATWTWNTSAYTVSFNANGGTGTMADQTFGHGETKHLDACQFTKEGYVFEGWSLTPAGSAAYRDEDSFSIGTSDIRLYAVWSPGIATPYQVRHWKQNVNGSRGQHDSTNYTLEETVNKGGVTGQLTEAMAKSYPGFTPATITQEEVLPDGSTIVDVYYERASYTLTFDANGGNIGTTTSQNFYYGIPAAMKTAANLGLSRSGYDFEGWATSANDTVSHLDGASYTIGASDTTLYAKWGAKTYKVLFNANGGTIGTTEQTFRYGIEEPLETAAALSLSRTGYQFIGWATSAAGSVSYTNGANYSVGTADATLFAVWLPNSATSYTVHHWQQKAGGNAGTHDSANYAEVTGDAQILEGTTGSATAAVAKSYSGFTSAPFSQQTIAADNSTVVDIYYDRNSYTLTFDANGGTIVTATQNFHYGVSEALKTATSLGLTRPGYNFGGWSTSSSGASPIADGASYTIGAANATLYAKWTAKTTTDYHVIHWQQRETGNAGIYDEANYVLKLDESKSGSTGAATEAAARTDYTGFTSVAFSQKTIAGDGSTVVDIYYNRNSYTVTFNANGGSIGTSNKSFTYGVAAALPTAASLSLAKTGYTLDGWAIASSGSKYYDDGASYTIGSNNVTLYAVWKPNTYTVKFNANGGTGTTSDQTLTYDAPATALNANGFSKTGSSFKGWATTASGAVTYTDRQTVRNLTATAGGTVNLYALWQNSGAITVTIMPDESDPAVGLGYTPASGKKFSFYANGGFTSYQWYLGVGVPATPVTGQTGSTYMLDCSSYTTGTSITVMVNVTSGGNTYSATAQVLVP